MPQKTRASSWHGGGEKGAIGGQQVRHQLTRHRQRGSILVVSRLVVNLVQLVVIHHADFRGLDQHRLQVSIALFG